MRVLDLAGARRGKRVRTTVPAADTARPADLVRRQFSPARPDRLWVADFTYVPAWTGMVYVHVRWKSSQVEASSELQIGAARIPQNLHVDAPQEHSVDAISRSRLPCPVSRLACAFCSVNYIMVAAG
jgi:transposase InsO family protein